MELVSRPNYYSKVEKLLGKGILIVLTGQRRVGKSYVMKELVQRKQNEDANVIYIDKEKTAFDFIANYKDLVAYIDEQRKPKKHTYILIDEVQEIEEFERGLRNYYDSPEIDIIVTGSNSDTLSSDLATLLSGRYVEIFIQGLSYEEFLVFHQLEDNDEALRKYINYGGLPGLRPMGLDDPEVVRQYLQGVYNTILVKDVVRRKKVRNVPFLENLIKYVGDNIGKPLSATNIQNYMTSNKNQVSKNLILKYLKATTEAFLVHNVTRYNLHGKKLLESNDKYYFGDVGLRNFIVGGRRANDIEKIMENLVYQHLIRLGYKVNVGQMYATEIDFVGTKGDDTIYVQASYLISEESTFEREFGNLQKINDNYPKYVISMTPFLDSSKYEGIIHVPLAEFLKKGLP
ncbi:MAG: ATP-binding protein [Bacteroidales bacterium]|nr:ATP-binding protein [Bacteroidales bacterium]MBR6161939.1 ATP-binding protein [Bacteroidales bacterium]MBR7024237.1 ATP-binding protein [Bacteroidales bacterium]